MVAKALLSPSFIGLAVSVAFVSLVLRFPVKSPVQARLWTSEELSIPVKSSV
uniref:Uncharacterized protein n=1 Tax=Nelumbo nucifera TaxID=4432 RepID=A0A822YSK1_NELNU|nr:TPA_asm: hypothetical protein HUJ06_006147 [Nelumbo nucifera]